MCAERQWNFLQINEYLTANFGKTENAHNQPCNVKDNQAALSNGLRRKVKSSSRSARTDKSEKEITSMYKIFKMRRTGFEPAPPKRSVP